MFTQPVSSRNDLNFNFYSANKMSMKNEWINSKILILLHFFSLLLIGLSVFWYHPPLFKYSPNSIKKSKKVYVVFIVSYFRTWKHHPIISIGCIWWHEYLFVVGISCSTSVVTPNLSPSKLNWSFIYP